MTANIEFSAICSLRKPEYLRTPRALRTTTLPPPPPLLFTLPILLQQDLPSVFHACSSRRLIGFSCLLTICCHR